MTNHVGQRRPRAAKTVVLIVVTALAATGLVSLPAFGVDPPPLSSLPDEGVLRLHLGSDGTRFAYEGLDGTILAPSQAIEPNNPSGCLISEAGPLAALSLAPTSPGSVGMDGFDVGIRRNGPRGVPCGRVDVGEGSLRVGLAGSGPLADKEIDYAEIDLEGKQDVAVAIQARLDGTSLGTPQLAFDCEMDTDCGPDSADGDNFRIVVAVAGTPPADPVTGWADVVVPAVFDELEFSIASSGGSFSVNGGSDASTPDGRGPLGEYLDTDDTLFHITDVEAASVVCGGDPVDLGTEEFFGTYSLHGCTGSKLLVFTLDTSQNLVTITNESGSLGGAYAFEHWSFYPEPADPNPVLFYNDGDGDFDALFCLTDPRGYTEPITSGQFAEILPPNEKTADPNDVHTTCVIVDERTTIGEGSGDWVLQIEVDLFSIGDASRGFR